MKWVEGQILEGTRFILLKDCASRNTNYTRPRMQILVQCQCGAKRLLNKDSVRRLASRSCGCLRIEIAKAQETTHGMSKTRVYGIWAGIITRCTTNRPVYKAWHGRGIKMCRAWRNSFETFLADMGHPPSDDHEIDRINNDKGYYKSNCRWATYEQQANHKRNNIFLNFRGERLTIAQWTKKLGFGYHLIHGRLADGWTVEQALTTPVRPMKKR